MNCEECKKKEKRIEELEGLLRRMAETADKMFAHRRRDLRPPRDGKAA